MEVQFLELHSFRNYRSLAIEPRKGLNIFVGENAQGKSNLLESLYVLATTKSMRAGRDTELISFGETGARVAARVAREKEIDLKIELFLSLTEKKAARINGARHTKMAQVIGQVNAALFESADLEIIRGEPSIRRRFLDLEVAQTSPRYVQALAAFRKSLEQRNFLLKEIRDRRARPGAKETLSAWNMQLATHGAVLMERRREFLARLAILAAEVHRSISEGRDKLAISYQPSFPIEGLAGADAIREEFLSHLARLTWEEQNRGMTLVGPQRDDIQFLVNAQESRLFASQGQQRTIALSVKLAERQLIEELVGEAPLLLLDDVLSDLDDIRRSHLFHYTASAGSQTFVTCTNIRAFPKSVLENAAIWRVVEGQVTRAE
jgi:DNA replication and repair protein RecF